MLLHYQKWSAVVSGKKIRDKNFNARNEDMSSGSRSSLGRKPRRKFKNCSAQATIEDRNMGVSCSTKHDASEKGTGKSRRSRSQSETRRHSKGGGNETSKGKDPKVPVRQDLQTSRYAAIFTKVQCQVESACDLWHPPECSHNKSQSGGTWQGSVFSSTQATSVTTKHVVMQLLP